MEEQFIVRRPRHEARLDSGCEVSVERLDQRLGINAELGDVSRHGLKLVVDTKIPEETRLRVRMQQPASKFDMSLNMTVRWSRPQDDGRWATGCLFDQLLSWETMGELFLNGILSAEEFADQPSSA